MSKGDDLVFPVAENGFWEGTLTKRELAAMLIATRRLNPSQVWDARFCVSQADELLAELERTEEKRENTQ